MTRTITGAWVAALCAAVMMMAARTDAAAGKKPAAKAKESITLTGCLHADGGKYMLTDLKGDEAPKGRNWKTAFITKTTKNVEVMPSSAGPKLKDHVGHEVTLTGVKNSDTNMQARSLKHVSGSCS
jgi:hypothetical protein